MRCFPKCSPGANMTSQTFAMLCLCTSCLHSVLDNHPLLAVAAAEEEQEGEEAQGDEDAASTAALDYMDSPSLLDSSAAGAGSRSSMQDHAAPAEPEQREDLRPDGLQQQAAPSHAQQSEPAPAGEVAPRLEDGTQAADEANAPSSKAMSLRVGGSTFDPPCFLEN